MYIFKKARDLQVGDIAWLSAWGTPTRARVTEVHVNPTFVILIYRFTAVRTYGDWENMSHEDLDREIKVYQRPRKKLAA